MVSAKYALSHKSLLHEYLSDQINLVKINGINVKQGVFLRF